MGTHGYQPLGSTNWLAVLAGTAFCAVSAHITFEHLDEAVGEVTLPALAMASPVFPTPRDPAPKPVSPEKENWAPVTIGSITLQLPGTPEDDRKAGWFDHYPKVERLHAFSLPVEHRQSHVRVSVIRYGKGRISLNAASLGAKRGIESEFSGVTTVFPFEFRDLPSRHVAARRVDLDDLTRLHTYLVINDNEMLILSVTGYDKHPNRLAHQILRTVEIH